jgi:hypothetical protein
MVTSLDVVLGSELPPFSVVFVVVAKDDDTLVS